MKRFGTLLRLSTQKGLTLLELIVSLTIGLFLLLAMALTYNVGFKVSQQVNDIASLHNNARTVFERIGRDLMLAGYVDLMDQPKTPFTEADGRTECLIYPVGKDTTYATHTLNFADDAVTRMYSRAVDGNTDAKVDRNRLSHIGLVSCGQMLPVLGCDEYNDPASPNDRRGFNLEKPSARQLVNTGDDFSKLCYRNQSAHKLNPQLQQDLAENSQIQIAYQAQSVSSSDKVSLRDGTTHQNDGTGLTFQSGTNFHALDCAGKPIDEDANGFVVNRYRLHNGQLQCLGNGGEANDKTYVEIANNIREFKVRYRLGASEGNDIELKDSRTGAIALDNKIASEINGALTANANGYENLADTDMRWSRVVGVELCLVVAGQPTDGIIPSNLAEAQEYIPTCTRANNDRDLYAAGTRRSADDKNYYLRLTKTFSIPNSIFQFEVNRKP